MIKVLITDDSSILRMLIKHALKEYNDINIVGEAVNGKQAIQMNKKLKPDIITMDVNMPELNGFLATKEIMKSNPVPIIIISDLMQGEEDTFTFEALDAGAVDVMNKPDMKILKEWSKKLYSKILELSKEKLNLHQKKLSKTKTDILDKNRFNTVEYLGIASSTGGPKALATILKEVPKGLNLKIAIVQHINNGFIQSLASWLNDVCPLNVSIAEKGEYIKAGNVYIAPDDYHLEINKDNTFKLNSKPPIVGFRPSGNPLLQSLADNFAHKSAGLILTGIGNDGLTGITSLKKAGGITLAQDKDSCVVYGMPKAAANANVIDRVLNLYEIASYITDLSKKVV